MPRIAPTLGLTRLHAVTAKTAKTTGFPG